MTRREEDDHTAAGAADGPGEDGGPVEDGPLVSRDALLAALWLVEAYVGDSEVYPRHSEDELQAQLEAAGEPTEIVRAGALMIGAMGGHVAERFAAAGEVDPHELATGGVARVQRGEHVPAAALPLIEQLFTAALVERADVVALIDALGPRMEHMGPVLEVLAALMDLVDVMHERPGAAVEIMDNTLDALTRTS